MGRKRARTNPKASSELSIMPSTGDKITQEVTKYPQIKNRTPKYNELAKLPCLPSRYPDKLAMKALCISLNKKLTAMGWDQLNFMNEQSYLRLTLEFLSTYEYSDDNARFRITNKSYVLSKMEIAGIFGWPTSGTSSLPKADEDVFWQEITRLPNAKFSGRFAKAADIVDRRLRYFHRVLAFTLFGQQNSGKVSTDELGVLYCFEKGKQADLTKILCERFAKMSKSDKGQILMGGLITRIAEGIGAFDRNNTDLLPIEGPMTVDIHQVYDMHLIKRNPDGFGYLLQTHPRDPTAAVTEYTSHTPLQQDAPTSSTADASTPSDRLERLESQFTIFSQNQTQLMRNQTEMMRQLSEYFKFVNFEPPAPPST